MAKVALERVTKIYPGNVKAVDGLCLAVEDGEFVVLVGPSGCGKSTTLRMLAGLEDVSAGTITIGDRIVNGVPPKDRDIAMVFQNYALYPHMTVGENMAFGLKLRKLPKDEIAARVQEAAAILGIGDLLDRRPKALSGGQRQRVAVGRAIVRNPAVFLFDEPLSNLDAKLRAQMRIEISRIHQRLGTTMIYVTHDQVEAMTMGQRIVVMRDGRVQQIAAPLPLYERPANRFVAGFIGTPPMNFIDGRMEALDASLVFEGPGAIRLPIPADRQPSLDAYRGRRVTLGLRPEDIGSSSAGQSPDAPRVRATVDIVEPIGSECYLHLRIADTGIVCRVDAHTSFRAGQTADFAVALEKAHFFDSTTDDRIEWRPAAPASHDR